MNNVQCAYSSYQRFCMHFKFKIFPANSWRLCQFAQYLFNLGKAPGTIANAVSIVCTSALKGYKLTDLYDVALKLHIKGLGNLSPHIVQQAEAMTPDILLKISSLVDIHDKRQVVAFTAILISFFLLLRKRNLVPDSVKGKKSFDPSK